MPMCGRRLIAQSSLRHRLNTQGDDINKKGIMRLLLTSAGISNTSIHNALVDLLGKPIAESSALCGPCGVCHARRCWRGMAADQRTGHHPLCELGWKSLGVLELTALPSIDEEHWVPMVQETDALLVGGGDVLYLCYWMQQSGLADLLPSLREAVYVGVSAGAWSWPPTSGRTSSAGVRPPVATERWEWLMFRCSLAWITRGCRTLPWPTENNGPQA